MGALQARAFRLPNEEYMGLRGRTLLRYCDMGKNTGGGVEQYLYELNRILIERYDMSIIQVYTVKEDDAPGIEVERIGKGSLVWVPSILRKSMTPVSISRKRILKKEIGTLLNIMALQSKYLSYRLRNHRYMHNPNIYYYEVIDSYVLEIVNACKIDLVSFHWVDERSEKIMLKILRKKIPFIIINHFDNTRFELPAMKKWAGYARGCAGVSNANVPVYLLGKFINLSDGIDTDFFHPDRCGRPDSDSFRPIVFLPSRLTPSKGHMDLICALSSPCACEIRPVVVFAGREDSTSFSRLLKSYIRKCGMEKDVIFTGQLDSERLRDWYGACRLVVLPSYSEGLGRVLLEAQAMGKPVVAYDTGGVSEAMRDGQTGYTAQVGHYRALRSRIEQILTDPAGAKRMGLRGRRLIEARFSFPGLVERHERFYTECLAANR